MTKILVYMLVIFAALFSPLASIALDETEDTEYAYGTVETIDLSTNTIVIKEQDYDTDTETKVTYYLNPDTDFENVDSLKDIAVGNDVDISYLVKDGGKKTIKFISVYKPELEEEEE